MGLCLKNCGRKDKRTSGLWKFAGCFLFLGVFWVVNDHKIYYSWFEISGLICVNMMCVMTG